jgi:hypothetical protein
LNPRPLGYEHYDLRLPRLRPSPIVALTSADPRHEVVPGLLRLSRLSMSRRVSCTNEPPGRPVRVGQQDRRSGAQRAREHLIRRSRHIVQDRPLPSVCWADIPELSARDRRCPAAWQQYGAVRRVLPRLDRAARRGPPARDQLGRQQAGPASKHPSLGVRTAQPSGDPTCASYET